MLDAHLAVFLRGGPGFEQWHQEATTLNQVLYLSEDGRANAAGTPLVSPALGSSSEFSHNYSGV